MTAVVSLSTFLTGDEAAAVLRGQPISTLSPIAEPYLDARTLAQLMGVSLSTVRRWDREGMPSENWGLRLKRYQLSRSKQWAAQRRRLKTSGSARVAAATAEHDEKE